MSVDLLDLVPQGERRETVAILGQEVEIRPLTVSQIAAIGYRFPQFGKSFMRDDQPEEQRSLAILTAWPAIVAAGLGHPGDRRYEERAERLPQADLLKLGAAILALTNPRSDDGPLPTSAEVIAAARAEAEPTNSPPA